MYPGWWTGREFEHKAEIHALGTLLSLIQTRKTIIDIGAGFGRLVTFYTPFFSKIILVDQSIDLLGLAKKYLAGIRGVEFIRAEAPNLPLPPNSADVVLCVRLIHHFENPVPIVSEAARVLNNGGFFILEFANKIHFAATLKSLIRGNFGFRKNLTFNNHHPQIILSALENHGFQVIEILSVSNFRFSLLKKLIPLPLLLFLEEHLQKPLQPVWFGPSIFVLAQKQPKA